MARYRPVFMPILSELNLYPVKSCAGVTLREASLTAAGLMSRQVHDREWMVVDPEGNFLTQRQHPKLATIMPVIHSQVLELNAPGMPALEIPLALGDAAGAPTLQVTVWDDVIAACDCGNAAAAWFSEVIGTSSRLVRFHPHSRRSANTDWTGGVEAPTLFSDGYPILVISTASLADLNEKLVAQGRAALPMNRFRPNIVIDGIDAFEEDFARRITIGAVTLRPVKPCPRCQIPSIDQASGETGPSPLDILQTYRANPKIGGGLAFGMNAIVQAGAGQVLRVGQEVGVELAF